jgi:O-antigen/teichoic acid export membrane protein
MVDYLKDILKRIKGDGVGASLVRGVGVAVAVRLLGIGFALGLQLLIARWLGAEVFGQYIYVFTWITILALFGKLGFDTASIRFIAAYKSLSEWGLVRGYLKRSREISFGNTIALSILGAVIVWLLRNKLGNELAKTFWIGLMLLPFMVVMQMYASYIQGLKHVGQAQLPHGVFRPLILSLLIIFLSLFGYKIDASAVMWMECFATAVVSVLACVMLRRLVNNRLTAVDAQYRTREWLGTSLNLVMISGAQMVLAKVGIVMVGAMIGPTEAGLFSAANTISVTVTFFLATSDLIIAPTISELYIQKKHSSLQYMVTVSALALTAIAIPVILAVILFGQDLLGLFGEEFKSQYKVLIILIAGQAMIAFCGSVGFLLTMSNYQAVASKVIGGSAILNIILNIILIPVLGVVGAAIGAAISVSARAIILAILVWKKLDIIPTPLGLIAYKRAAKKPSA